MNLESGFAESAPSGAGGRSHCLTVLYADPPDAARAASGSAERGTRPAAMPRDLVALYAARTAGHVADLREAIHGHRAGTVLSLGAIGVAPVAAVADVPEPIAFGRGTAAHREAVWWERVARREAQRRPSRGRVPAPAWQPAAVAASTAVPVRQPRRTRRLVAFGSRRRAAAAVVTALILLLGVAGSGFAQGRYRVQEGDTLESVAAEFGVDPAAIAAASYIQNYPDLTPGEVIVIPEPGQTPDEAAAEAAAMEGTNPWVVGAYVVQPGDTLAAIAYAWGLDAATLADFNGVTDPENLEIGTRLLIPPSRDGATQPVAAAPVGSFVAGVGHYVQSRNLSCEYAAAHIATSAFGAGVPEWVFIEQVPPARNPHYGYRGNIDGWWGNTDDYGVYAEALVPVLNTNGFRAEVFYSMGATGDLVWYIDQGIPVIVWLGLWGDTAVTLYDEGTYTVAAGAHVVVAYGYDVDGVYVSDPAIGATRLYGWSDFTAMWSVLDGMALAVSPY
jgi:LysM repeat protein